MPTLFATPCGYYNNFSGFSFESYEEFEENFKKAKTRLGVEEYSIECLEGGEDELKFAKAWGLEQCSLERFFELVEDINWNDGELEAFEYLTGHCGYDAEESLDKIDDVRVFEGKPEEYAEELVRDCYSLSDFALRYFDFEKLARDMLLSGELVEQGSYLITNPLDL